MHSPSPDHQNRRRLLRPLVIALAFVLQLGHSPDSASAQPPQASGSLKAGAALSNITPPLGGGIVGGFTPIPATDVHDELHARCLVLDDGRSQIALVVCDLLGLHQSLSKAARLQIQTQCSIPAENVLICATHTHSATSALGEPRYQLEVQLDSYQQFVVQRIADGVQRAKNRLKPAELGFGTINIPEHLFNRRWFMRDGTVPPNPFGTIDKVKMNPPAGSRNLLEPAGPIDPAVSIISLREAGDGPGIAAFTAWSLHYVGGTTPGSISADYFGMYCSRLEYLQSHAHPDKPFVALMANGTSGDINNINFRNPRPSQPAWEQMQIVADDVAARVNDAIGKLSYSSIVPLRSVWRELEVGLRHPAPELLHWADETLAKPAPPPGETDLSRIYAERVRSLETQPPTAMIPLQVLQLGNVTIGTMPCEVFCEIGLEFRKRGPQPAFLVSLSHGYYGYLPTPLQHLLGGYETWPGTNRLEVRASEKMLNTLLEMARTDTPPAPGPKE